MVAGNKCTPGAQYLACPGFTRPGLEIGGKLNATNRLALNYYLAMTLTKGSIDLVVPRTCRDESTDRLVRSPRHCFTVDVEEHFQVSAFESVVPRSEWDRQPSRVVENTERLLDLLAEHQSFGTFFVLGWVADRHPELVKKIANTGHEVGSHGWWHYRATDRKVFAEEIRSSKRTLEDVTGHPVRGFRAPSFSITEGREWAFDELLEAGYQYDSSIFPIRRPGYGYPSAPRWPYRIQRPAGQLLELPMTTLAFGPMRLPAAGGGYLRQIPFGVIRAAFREAEERGGPGMFYIHPWEVDVDQPRLSVGPITRMRHYRGLERSMPRMRRLLQEFQFTSVARWIRANISEDDRHPERVDPSLHSG